MNLPLNEKGPKRSLLETAIALSRLGFHIFPLIPGKKTSIIKDPYGLATRDEDQIRKWWTHPKTGQSLYYNIGIFTGKFGDDKALVVVDIDCKGEKKGKESYLKMTEMGKSLPKTYTQTTATGGKHRFYVVDKPLKGGVNRFKASFSCPDIDVVSDNWYVVGGGSVVDGKSYTHGDGPLEDCPPWLIDFLGAPENKDNNVLPLVPENINQEAAAERAKFYLLNEAELSIKGQGGDIACYKVACHMKNLGVSAPVCLELMLDNWNDRCPPGWSVEKLQVKIMKAFSYSRDAAGSLAPEAHFDKIEMPEGESEKKELDYVDNINKEHAMVLVGGDHTILWETTGAKGEYKQIFMSENTFHKFYAKNTVMVRENSTDKLKKSTKMWMESDRRRTYKGFCFTPGKEAYLGYYNLWTGFAVSPLDKGELPTPVMKKAVDDYLKHILENACDNQEVLFNWLVGYFAHLIQRPWEKPLVALVFQGDKGVGKNAIIDRIGDLLGHHFMLAAKPRLLLGNFNGHLQYRIFMALDEAFWSGNKEADGVLKDLITGQKHVIEMKGKEPYEVDNLLRVCIMGNESALVNATDGERRFAVFNFGNKMQKNNYFFGRLQDGMQKGGGLRYLLRFLMDFDLSGVDVNAAPDTEGLYAQKRANFGPFQDWWEASLIKGHVLGYDFTEDWPDKITRDEFRGAFRNWSKLQGKVYPYQKNLPDNVAIGRLLNTYLPDVGDSKINKVWCYILPCLEKARGDWESVYKVRMDWDRRG